MAELVADLLGEAMLVAIHRHRPRLSEAMGEVREWLEDAARPPDGVQLKSSDGSSYTGFVVVERNELVMMLAVRHPAGAVSPAPARPPVVTPAPREEPLPYRGYPDPDDPVWDRDPRFNR